MPGMVNNTNSTRRKDVAGIPKTDGLTGGAFASKGYDEDTTVTLAYPVRLIQDMEWATIETADELAEALDLEEDLLEERVADIDVLDPNYAERLDAITNDIVERYATIVARIDTEASAYKRRAMDDVWTRTLDHAWRVRVDEFSNTWRVRDNGNGTFAAVRGVENPADDARTLTREQAESRVRKERARDTRGALYPRLVAADKHWDGDLTETNEEDLDAYAAAFPNDAQNVTSVNPWFGLTRFEKLSGPDEVIVHAGSRFTAAEEIMKYERKRLLNVPREMLTAGGSLDDIAERVSSSEAAFGALIGAVREDGVAVESFTHDGRTFNRFSLQK